MGRIFLRSDQQLTKVNTTRLISIGTDAATEITATSGAIMWDVTMLGPSISMVYGDSSIGISSAGILFYSMTERFQPLQGDFSMFFRADSVAGTISVVEFE